MKRKINDENSTDKTISEKVHNGPEVSNGTSAKLLCSNDAALSVDDQSTNFRSTAELEAQAQVNVLKNSPLLMKDVNAFLALLKKQLRVIPEASCEDAVATAVRLAKEFDVQQYFEMLVCLVPSNGKFIFAPPNSLWLTGSFPLELNVNPNLTVDIAVEVPKATFEEGSLNTYSYHLKMLLFLLLIASKLRTSKFVKQLNLEFFHDDPRKLIIVLHPKGDLDGRCIFHLIAYPEEGTFQLEKFAPSVHHLNAERFLKAFGEDINGTNLSSHFYNQSVARDVVMMKIFNYLEDEENFPKNARAGVQLLRLWIRRRELDQGYGCVSCTFLSLFVCYLVKERRIQSHWTAWDVFKAAIFAFSNIELENNPVTLCQSENGLTLLNEFKSAFPIVFTDPTGYANVCAHWHASTWRMLKHEALLARQMIENADSELFTRLCLQPVPFAEKFDIYFTINLPKSMQNEVWKNAQLRCRLIDMYGLTSEAIWKDVYDCMWTALGDRVLLIGKSLVQYENKMTNNYANFEKALTFGILIESGRKCDFLIRGPAANLPEAVNFRRFWGDKSQMRKFKSYGICEAVLFDRSNVRSIFGDIVYYVLNRHIKISRKRVISSDISEESCLALPGGYRFVEKQLRLSLHTAMAKVEKCLQLLTDMPFQICELTKMGSIFSDLEVYYPVPVDVQYNKLSLPIINGCFVPEATAKVPPWCPSCEMMMIIDIKCRHLNSLSELRIIKTGCCIQVSEQLRKRFKLLCQPIEKAILIFTNGYVFRLHVSFKSEEFFLKNLAEEKKNHPAELEAESMIRWKQALFNQFEVLRLQFESFSTTVRLAKRWVANKMLSGHFSDEAVELIIASLFLTPQPFAESRHHLIGFLRFLRLLSTFPWSSEPLIVNFNNLLTDEEILELKQQWKIIRPTLPPFCLLTPDDHSGARWTRAGPSSIVADYIIRRAAFDLSILQNHGLSTSTLRIINVKLKNIFPHFQKIMHSGKQVFDVVILLNRKRILQPTVAPVEEENAADNGKANAAYNLKALPVVDFSPVEFYVRQLKENYGQFGLFFWNRLFSSHFVGVLWNNRFRKIIQHQKDQQKIQATVCTDEIIKGFYALGYDLVKRIVVQ
ncbi:Nucleolar protein 6 [Trichinella papuae]|uniref:Nucleolar protein 6 n=1 Tax=Trichinella papuae TaxID=268474 RepID=A0A0V1MKK7_9BILA|nr:Nucleolar protein 6 [Trichinella papuae]